MKTSYKTIMPVKRGLQRLLAIGLFFVLPAFAVPGNLDRAFGIGGIVVSSFTNTPYSDFPRSIQVQHQATIAIAILL